MVRLFASTLMALILLAPVSAVLADEPPEPGPQVKLFMTSWCHYCRLTSQFLRSKGVTFTEHDIESDPKALSEYLAIGGGSGVPLVVIGDERVLGYDVAAMERALAALPQPAEEPSAPPTPQPEEQPAPEKKPDGKWPKTARMDEIDIFGDVHEPEVTYITTRDDVADEVELELTRSFVGELVQVEDAEAEPE